MEEDKWETSPLAIPEVTVAVPPTDETPDLQLEDDEDEDEGQKSDLDTTPEAECSILPDSGQGVDRNDDDSNFSESSANRADVGSTGAISEVNSMLTQDLILSTFQHLAPSSSFLPSYFQLDDTMSLMKNAGIKRGPGRPRKKEGSVTIQRKKMFPGRPRVQTRRTSHKAIISPPVGAILGASPSIESTLGRFDHSLSKIRGTCHSVVKPHFFTTPSKLSTLHMGLSASILDTEESVDTKIGNTKLQQAPMNLVQDMTVLDEQYQEMKKACSFCNLGDESLLGQGDLVRFDPSAGFNPFKKGLKSRRSSSESDSSVAVEALSKLSPPRRGKGRRSSLPASEPLILGPADELTIVGFPDEPELTTFFESSGHTYAHHCCAAWSEGVCQTAEFVLINVDKAVFAAMSQSCSSCRRYGAAIRCRGIKCNRVYHYPCAVSSGTFQDIKTLTLLCPFHLNQAPMLAGAEANCIVCDVPGNISELLFCTSCGHHYHGTCLEPAVAVNPVVRAGWQCPECKICQTCRQPGDDNKMLVCDTCDKGFHTFCLKPMMATIPKNGWKCKSCRVCGDCGSRTPGSGPSSRWHMNYTVCDSCYQQRNKGVACPLCRKAYRQFCQRAEMAQCTLCKKYIHMECDPRIEKHRDVGSPGSYTCPVCVNAQIQGLSTLPTMDASVKVKDDSPALGFESPDDIRSCMGDDSSMEQQQSMKLPIQAFVAETPEDMQSSDIVPLITDSPIHRHVSGGKKRITFSRLRGSSGKFAGRRRAKTAEFRRKRGPKPKVRSFLFGGSPLYHLSSLMDFRESKQDDEPTVDNKIVLCSTYDEYVLSQDLCVMCGSFGKDDEGRLIACSQCGQCYHPYCVNVKLTKVVLKKGWRCLDCTVCEGCGQPHDEGRLLLCDDCDISYHTYCSDPPLEEVPQGNWKCKWCVVCYQCGATNPGTGSSWQNNYTLCGPCSSETICPVCYFNYQDNDLVLQCTLCDRWLHGKCDQILLEDEAEKAAEYGYHCILCRPKDEPPPHLISRVQSRSPSPIEHELSNRVTKETNSYLTLGNRYEFDDSAHQLDDSETSTMGVYDLVPDMSSKMKNQAQFYMDGVFLSESGMTLIKSMTIEQPKKQRMRRQKNPSGALSPGKQAVLSSERKLFELDDTKPPGPAEVSCEVETKMEVDDEVKPSAEDAAKLEAVTMEKKRRQRKLHKLGIGGFIVKARGRSLSAKEDNLDSQDVGDISLTIDGCEVVQDKPKRKRRPKKKNPLEDNYPGYIQEAFFGKELLITAKENSSTDLQSFEDGDSSSSFLTSQLPEKQTRDLATPSSTITSASGQQAAGTTSQSSAQPLASPGQDLSSKSTAGQQQDDLKDESKKIFGTKAVEEEDLGDTEALKDLLPLPQDDELMDMLMNGDDELKQDDEGMAGLPQMDSKDVEDIFKGVLSPSTMAEQQHTIVNPSPPAQLPTGNLSSSPLPSQGGQSQAPTTPGSLQSIGSPFSMPPPSPYPSEYGGSQFSPQVMDMNPWSELDAESQSHTQKSSQKWESDETLGTMATTSPVLYANINHPNLKLEYPLWSDRVKQIAKIWRGLPTEKRQPYLIPLDSASSGNKKQKARENRTANRMQKSQSVGRVVPGEWQKGIVRPPEEPAVKEVGKGPRDQRTQREVEQERHWKQMQVIRQQQHQQQQQVLQEQRMQAMAKVQLLATEQPSHEAEGNFLVATQMSPPVHNSPSSSMQPDISQGSSEAGLQAVLSTPLSPHPNQGAPPPVTFHAALSQQSPTPGRSPTSVSPLIQVSRVRPPIDPSRLPTNDQQSLSPGTPRPVTGDPFVTLYRHPAMGGRPVLTLPQKQQPQMILRPEGPRLPSPSTPTQDYYQTPPATPCPQNVDSMQSHVSSPSHPASKMHQDPYSHPPSTPRPYTSPPPPPPSPQVPSAPPIVSSIDPYAQQPGTPHPSVGIQDSYISSPVSAGPSRIPETVHQLQQQQTPQDQMQQFRPQAPPSSQNVNVALKPNLPAQMALRHHGELDPQQVMKIAMQQGLTLDSEGAQQIIARQHLRDLLQRQQQKKQEHGQIPLRHWPPGSVTTDSRMPGGNDIFRPPLPPGMRPRVITTGMLGNEQPFRHPAQLLDQRLLLQRASQDPRLRAALIQQQQQLRGHVWAQMRVQGPRMATGFLVKNEGPMEPHQQMVEGQQQKNLSHTTAFDIGEKFGQPKVCLPTTQQPQSCLSGPPLSSGYLGPQQQQQFSPKGLGLTFPAAGNQQDHDHSPRSNVPPSSPGVPTSPHIFQQQQHHLAMVHRPTNEHGENQLVFQERIVPKLEKLETTQQSSCAVLAKAPVQREEDNVEKKKQTAGDLVKEVEEQAVTGGGVDLEDDLDDDDELLGLGNDFNILEYADPELDSGLVGDGEKNNILDEHLDLDEKDDDLGTGDVIDLKSNIDSNLKKHIAGEELKKQEVQPQVAQQPRPPPSPQIQAPPAANEDVKMATSESSSCKLEQLEMKLQEEKKFVPEFQVKCGPPFHAMPLASAPPFPVVQRQPEMPRPPLTMPQQQRIINQHMAVGQPPPIPTMVQNIRLSQPSERPFLKPPPAYQPSPNMAHFQGLVGQPRLPHPPPPPQIIPNPRLQSMSSNIMIQRPPVHHQTQVMLPIASSHEEVRLSHQEQPLLLEDLVEQEKLEQKRHSQENLMSPPADALLSDIDFERLKADVLSGPPDDTIGGPATIVSPRPSSSDPLLQAGPTSSPHLQQFLQSHALAHRNDPHCPSWQHMVQSPGGVLRPPFPGNQMRPQGQVMGPSMRIVPQGIMPGDGTMRLDMASRMDLPLGGSHAGPRNTFPITLPAPPLPPSDPVTEQDRQQHAQYEQWLAHQQALLSNQQKYLETEVGKLRKSKKSLNARQRQLRRNGQELADHDAAELARITQEQAGLQKQLDQVRKQGRQHTMLFQEYRVKQQKWQQQVIPQSPTHPQVVSMQLSPLGACASPHRPGSITPQSPLMSPSPLAPSTSPRMQHSPLMQHHSPIGENRSPMIQQSPVGVPRSPVGMMQHSPGPHIPQSPIMQQPPNPHLMQQNPVSMQQQHSPVPRSPMMSQPPNSQSMMPCSPVMGLPPSPMMQQQQMMMPHSPIRSPMPQSPMMPSQVQQTMVPQPPAPIRSPMMPQSPMMQQQQQQMMIQQQQQQQSHILSNQNQQQNMISQSPIRSPMMPQSPVVQQNQAPPNQQPMMSQSPAPIRSPMQPMMQQSPTLVSQPPVVGIPRSPMQQQQVLQTLPQQGPIMATQSGVPIRRPPLAMMQQNIRMMQQGMQHMIQGNFSQTSVVYRGHPVAMVRQRMMQSQQEGARPQLLQEDANQFLERFQPREEHLQQRALPPQGQHLQEARDSLSRILTGDLVGQPFAGSIPVSIISSAPGIVVQTRPVYTLRESALTQENLLAFARRHSLEGREVRLPILDQKTNQPIRTPLNVILERMSSVGLARPVLSHMGVPQLERNPMPVTTQNQESLQGDIKDNRMLACVPRPTSVGNQDHSYVGQNVTPLHHTQMSEPANNIAVAEKQPVKMEKPAGCDTTPGCSDNKCSEEGNCPQDTTSTQQTENNVTPHEEPGSTVINPSTLIVSSQEPAVTTNSSTFTMSGTCQDGHGCPDNGTSSTESQPVAPKEEQVEKQLSMVHIKTEEGFSCQVAANAWTSADCQEETASSCREQPLISKPIEESPSSQIQSVTHTLSFTLRQTGMPSTSVSPQQSTAEPNEETIRPQVAPVPSASAVANRPVDVPVQAKMAEHIGQSLVTSKESQPTATMTVVSSSMAVGTLGIPVSGHTPFHVSATLKSLAIKAEKKDINQVEVKREFSKLASCQFAQSGRSESSSPEHSPLTMGPGVANHTYAAKLMDAAEKPTENQPQIMRTTVDSHLEGDLSADLMTGLEGSNQNVLLKQLLQNCPSAENLPKDDEFSDVGKEKTLDENSSLLEKQNEDLKAKKITYIAKRNVPLTKGPSQPSLEIPQAVKSSSRELEIRRAQLEREPTPPPPPHPDEKPKRKRPKKRKDPKEGSPTKKRTKKGAFGKEDSHESFMESLIIQLRSLPPIRITEPTIQPNFNVCPLVGSGDMNVKETQLRGSFGNANLPSQSDCYSTRPFGSNPPTPPSSLPPTPPPIRGFYNQEFATKTKDSQGRVDVPSSLPTPPPYLDTIRPFRDADSPDTILSSSSPECLLSDSTYKFLGLRLIEDNTPAWNGRKSCSPVVPLVAPIPIHAITRLPFKMDTVDEDDDEKDKENKRDDILLMKTKMIGMGTPSIPLKDSVNVSVTLTLTSAAAEDIRGVLASLADILNIPPPTAYEIVERTATPPSQKLGLYKKAKDQAVNIHTLLNGKPRFCRHCDIVVLSAGILKKVAELPYLSKEDMEEDEVIFCSTNCYMQFALMHRALASTEEKEAAAVVNHTTSETVPEKKSPEPKEETERDANETEKSVEEDEEKTKTEASTPSMPSTPKPLDQSPQAAGDVVKKEKVRKSSKKSTAEGKHPAKKKKGQKWCYWAPEDFSPKSRPAVDDGVNELLDSMCMFVAPEKFPADVRKCVLCHEVGDGESSGPARLLNMDVNKWVHLNCALWSAEVYETVNGALINVDVACKRALILSCSKCHKTGASLKCFKIRCSNIYHFPCAVKDKCVFFKDKTVLCSYHSPKLGNPDNELESLAVLRRVYVNRDEHKQIASMIHQGEQNLLRVGSLIFLNIGQLLPQQLQAFHTCNSIYPVGYKIVRMYWSMHQIAKRCQYICSVQDNKGKPEFQIQVRDRGHSDVFLTDVNPKGVWMKILEPIEKMRRETNSIKVFPNFISGEDLYGLTEPAVLRILESVRTSDSLVRGKVLKCSATFTQLPGVDTLNDYNFKYGRSPLLELPLAINPTGCARAEPKLRTHFKRPHTLHTSNTTRFFLQSTLAGLMEASSPYTKQFVHSKSSQYRKMKTEWRNNVYLARSQIQGLGLYAARDIEKHTMVIEYIGQLIRNEIAERNEAIYEAQNRGVYMFRLDENRVIDATLSGGLARYMNHSCNPNCVAEVVQIDRDNKILIIANRRISRGEELTYDYKFEVEDDQHKISCLCGAFCCRKWMN